MQTTSATMLTALSAHESGSNNFDCIEVIEVYAHDYQPGVNGYDPDDAEKRWCGILGFTFLTNPYERQFVERGDIHRYMDKKENTCTLTFSNIDRSMAQWVQANEIEGKQGVIRVLSSGTSTVLADSLVIFSGRIDKAGDFDDGQGSLTITQRFGQINQQFPPRTFGPNDPQGRAPNDPEFEGFRFSAAQRSILWTTRERSPGWGGLFGGSQRTRHSMMASTHSDVSSEVAVPDGFGRVQVFPHYIGTIDIGNSINFALGVMEGVIDSYLQIRQTNPNFTQLIESSTDSDTDIDPESLFYGYVGGQGPAGQEQIPYRQRVPGAPIDFPGDGYHSRLAWIAGFVNGSAVDVDEATAPEWLVLLKAKIIKTPTSGGVWSVEEWSDSPVAVARYLLSDSRYFNEGEDAMQDDVNYQTYLHCRETILDSTKGEWVFLPQTDAALHGEVFSQYRSTGLIDSKRVRMEELGSLAGDPQSIIAEVEPFDPTDPPEPFDTPSNTNLRAQALRQRYTCNVVLVERISALDFLYNVIAPTGRLFFRKNGKGRIEIHSEKPADNTRLRTTIGIGVTAIPVTDVDPWKIGPLLLTQKLLIGNTLTTSEVRTVTAAAYTADANAIPIASSGTGITVTASGAMLSGGSSSVAASGTFTLSGTPDSGDIANITVGNQVFQYVLDSSDTLESAANLIAKRINATPGMSSFVKATSSGAVVTVTAKWGVLTISSGVANVHEQQRNSPTVAPTLTASTGGVLPAGTWRVVYAYRTAIGTTNISPVASVTVVENGDIDVTGLGALPGGIVSVDWYVSKYVGSTELVFWANNNGSAFTIGTAAMPDPAEALPPDYNESGEELLRIAQSFASNDQGSAILAQAGLTKGNIHSNTFRWPLTSKQSNTNMTAGRFFDSTEDYAPVPIEVHDYEHQARIRKVNKKEYDLSGFDNYSQATRYLNFQLSRNREGDEFNSLSAGPLAMLLEEGDIICASSDNTGLVNFVTRVEEISIGPGPTFTTKIIGRKYSTLMFSDRVRQHNIPLPTTLRALTPIPSQIEFIDMYPMTDQDRVVSGFEVAVSYDPFAQGSWRGWTLWADYGDGYVRIAGGDAPATIGTTNAALPEVVDDTEFDTVNTFTFELLYGPLPAEFETVTQADLEANPKRNLFLVGTEYVQAATITEAGDNIYTAKDLYRGRFQTSTEHESGGERVVVIDGTAAFVPTDISFLNMAIDYKVVSVNEDIDDVSPTSFTWEGNRLREPRVSDIMAALDGANDFLVQFTGNPSPMDQAPDYEVEVWKSDDRDDVADRVRVLPAPVASSNAALLVTANPTDVMGGKGGITAQVSTHTDNNNLTGAPAGTDGTTLQVFNGQYQRMDFSVSIPDVAQQVEGVPMYMGWYEDGTSDALVSNTANMPFYLEYNFDSGPNTTAISVGSYGETIATVMTLTEAEMEAAEHRWSLMMGGREYRAYLNFNGVGSAPVAVLAAPGDGFPLPVRGLFEIVEDVEVTSINIVNRLGTIYSKSNQKLDYGNITFTASAATDLLTSANSGFNTGDEFQVVNIGGALPAPLVAATNYFVRDATTDTFKVASTLGGAAINITTDGTGTQRLHMENKKSFHLRIFQKGKGTRPHGIPVDISFFLASGSALKKEDADYLLKEDTDNILLES